MIEMTRERYQQRGTADGSGAGNKRKKRWKRQTNLLTQTCPCFSTKIRSQNNPTLCVYTWSRVKGAEKEGDTGRVHYTPIVWQSAKCKE